MFRAFIFVQIYTFTDSKKSHCLLFSMHKKTALNILQKDIQMLNEFVNCKITCYTAKHMLTRIFSGVIFSSVSLTFTWYLLFLSHLAQKAQMSIFKPNFAEILGRRSFVRFVFLVWNCNSTWLLGSV